MSGCNRVVSQCEMAGASVTIPHRHRPNNAPTAGTFRVGRRELISEASGRIDLYLVMLLFRS
jgi:hypothetical protein